MSKRYGPILAVDDLSFTVPSHNHLVWLADSNEISRHRVDEVLATVGLSEVGHRRAGDLSGRMDT